MAAPSLILAGEIFSHSSKFISAASKFFSFKKLLPKDISSKDNSSKDDKSIEQFKKIIEYYIKLENIKDIKPIVSFIRKMEKYNLMMKVKNNNLKYC